MTMAVTMVWDGCALYNGEWTNQARTAFWVKVPRADIALVAAVAADPDALIAAAEAEQSGGDFVYLLVSDDLGSVMQMPEWYPISGQWNGMSPFRELDPAVEISDLDELTRLET